MSKGPATFRRADLKRAISAAQDLGLSLERVEIGKDGTIILVPGKPANDDNPTENGRINSFDQLLGPN